MTECYIFFLSPLPIDPTPTGSFLLPFALCGSSVTSIIPAMTATFIICITVAHAKLQIMMLTLPVGAFGNASIHSKYAGTQPFGSQKSGRRQYQNCKKRSRPLVLSQRAIETLWSMEDLNAWRDCAMERREYQHCARTYWAMVPQQP
jgi:hypothetical protein